MWHTHSHHELKHNYSASVYSFSHSGRDRSETERHRNEPTIHRGGTKSRPIHKVALTAAKRMQTTT